MYSFVFIEVSAILRGWVKLGGVSMVLGFSCAGMAVQYRPSKEKVMGFSTE